MSAAMETGARDRSRSPLRIESLPDAARAALDVVCKRDGEARIKDQRATIARLRQELAAKDVQIQSFRSGRMVMMSDVWRMFFNIAPRFRRESRNVVDTAFADRRSLMEYLYTNFTFDSDNDDSGASETNEEEDDEDEDEDNIE